MEKRLNERRLAGNFRELQKNTGLVDFCSNDYLGFARSAELRQMTADEISSSNLLLNGSTGSRLLAGNYDYTEELEDHIARLYGSEAGLIFNSGYDANLGLLSSLPQRGDTIITDELIHASIIDGARLSHANRYSFKHNDLESLEDKLKHTKGNCYVVIESVYSMDGDTPPIADILALTENYNANLIVDEAHAVGLCGFGLVSLLGLQNRVFARVITFGKALGCHGAIVLSGSLMRSYLVNFARSFIYTTAAPQHQLASVKMAHKLLYCSTMVKDQLRQNISLFKQEFSGEKSGALITSDSAIQCILLKSNEKAKAVASALKNSGLDVRPILSPTVAAGSERIRICLHAFNTLPQIILLAETLNTFD